MILKKLWQRWLEVPRFSVQLFMAGLPIFFSGALTLWWFELPGRGLELASYGVMGLGIALCLPGYLGIWRWRWLNFRNH